jgi:hypothetical protein
MKIQAEAASPAPTPAAPIPASASAVAAATAPPSSAASSPSSPAAPAPTSGFGRRAAEGQRGARRGKRPEQVHDDQGNRCKQACCKSRGVSTNRTFHLVLPPCAERKRIRNFETSDHCVCSAQKRADGNPAKLTEFARCTTQRAIWALRLRRWTGSRSGQSQSTLRRKSRSSRSALDSPVHCTWPRSSATVRSESASARSRW